MKDDNVADSRAESAENIVGEKNSVGIVVVFPSQDEPHRENVMITHKSEKNRLMRVSSFRMLPATRKQVLQCVASCCGERSDEEEEENRGTESENVVFFKGYNREPIDSHDNLSSTLEKPGKQEERSDE